MEASMRVPALIACCVLAATPLWAQSVDNFYKGKQIHMVVGTEAGQDYDTWARLMVRHMRQYVPGNPTFVVENMPGAGSLIAANHLYNKAAQDGTVLGMVSRNIPNYAIMHQPNANYDPRKFKVIDGYKGATGVILAMERGEVQGICQTTSAFAGSAQRLLDDGTFRILFTTEREAVPALKVPTIFAYAKTEEERDILEIHASSLELGRPMLAPPNVPAERVAALRQAFAAAVRDPGLLAEAKQMSLTVGARSGEEIAAAIRAVAELPDELIAKAARMTRPQ